MRWFSGFGNSDVIDLQALLQKAVLASESGRIYGVSIRG